MGVGFDGGRRVSAWPPGLAVMKSLDAGPDRRDPPTVPSSEMYEANDAERYDDDNAGVSTPEALDPMLDVLVDLAGSGKALEFASGTGRVTVPLARRGVKIDGIELSPHMTRKLCEKTDLVQVVVGDMATAAAPHVGDYSLVFLVFNTISNLRTQEEQVECFRNAARHLRPGGRFVIELWVPQLQRMAPGLPLAPMHFGEDGYLVFDTYDVATQECASHHYRPEADGSTRYGMGRFRYVWPGECDLMAQLAGLRFESRWASWDRSPFGSSSASHVSVWRKPHGA